LRQGDLVRRFGKSNIQFLGEDWLFPNDKLFIVARGLHEASVHWNDRVMTVGIVIDIIDPETGQLIKNQPVSDFVVVVS
jgi:hypothetical protein